jgi:hypothetical protein
MSRVPTYSGWNKDILMGRLVEGGDRRDLDGAVILMAGDKRVWCLKSGH